MDIYKYLKKDHKKVKQLMEDLLEEKSTKRREQMFEEISSELLLHAKTEQDTFYKELENEKQTEERIDEAEDEHKEIQKYIKKLTKLKFSSPEWLEQYGEFKHSVSHHVHEEEDIIFKKAKEILSDERAEELAAEMDELKKEPKYLRQAHHFMSRLESVI